jgi:hypothetical protein
MMTMCLRLEMLRLLLLQEMVMCLTMYMIMLLRLEMITCLT